MGACFVISIPAQQLKLLAWANEILAILALKRWLLMCVFRHTKMAT